MPIRKVREMPDGYLPIGHAILKNDRKYIGQFNRYLGRVIDVPHETVKLEGTGNFILIPDTLEDKFKYAIQTWLKITYFGRYKKNLDIKLV